MSQVVEKCPMCGIQIADKCDLMVEKGENTSVVCCCENLKKTSVKKQR